MPRTKANPQDVADQLDSQTVPDVESALDSIDGILAQELSASVVRNVIAAQRELVRGLGSLKAAQAAATVEAQEAG
jgi:hypothetical protein